jgi:hypothetical protein
VPKFGIECREHLSVPRWFGTGVVSSTRKASVPFGAICGHYQRREAKFVRVAQERVGLGRS